MANSILRFQFGRPRSGSRSDGTLHPPIQSTVTLWRRKLSLRRLAPVSASFHFPGNAFACRLGNVLTGV